MEKSGSVVILTPPAAPALLQIVFLTLVQVAITVLDMREKIESFGETGREPIWQAAGFIMSEFQKVEMILRGLFARLLDGDDNVTLAIYDTAPALSGRIELTMNAARSLTASRLQKCSVEADEIKDALNLVRKAAEKRNLVAHGVATHVTQLPTGGFRGCWLQVSNKGRTYYMTADEVIACVVPIRTAHEAIRPILDKLQA
ncbi:hypothetical protein J5Y06_18730 [Tianweitania sediminis]|uniref:Uncharacterized protein n=1 Tax=Tianweitania sediminis TaxID=1502156 RepID=A0A8J7R1V3_9HYPH|nr:hypothetical protein [Tianweitania sediminis]